MASNEPYKYPVCPSFTNWRFPHDSFPNHWSSQTTSRATLASRPPTAFSEKIMLATNGICIMTGYTTSVQACHLCPRSQADWFRDNRMQTYNDVEYNRIEHVVDDIANGITLREDLHLYFDLGGFVLMPKSDSGYTLHCLQPSNDILPMFHNHKTHPITNVRAEFLYTRLAYAILPKVAFFLSSPRHPKSIIRVKADSSFETEIVDISAKEFAKQSQSQNPSRKERSRVDSSLADDHSWAQELSPDLDPTSYKKRKLCLTSTSTYTSQPRSPSVFGTSPTAPLSQNEFRDLKNSWIERQRPLDYASPQKTESLGGDLKCGLGNTPGEDS